MVQFTIVKQKSNIKNFASKINRSGNAITEKYMKSKNSSTNSIANIFSFI